MNQSTALDCYQSEKSIQAKSENCRERLILLDNTNSWKLYSRCPILKNIEFDVLKSSTVI